jgi:hypothetical protein
VKRVLILVEGNTEEGIVKQVLAPHLLDFGVVLEPTIVTTKVVVGGPQEKGGGDFGKIRRHLQRLLGDSNVVAITTLFDFYGFPKNVPGASPSLFTDIERLEAEVARGFRDSRLRPYLQRHELEALLFVDPDATAAAALAAGKARSIASEARGFDSPEDINLHPDGAPSKRLEKILGKYAKPVVASAAIRRIGLTRIRAACPRFAAWLTWLESLGERECARQELAN